MHTDIIEQRDTLRGKIKELDSERKQIKRTIERCRRLEEKLSEVESELDNRIDRIGQLETEASERQTDIDELEALDAERIATLIDYLAEYAPNVLVALLAEDAQAVNEEYGRGTEI